MLIKDHAAWSVLSLYNMWSVLCHCVQSVKQGLIRMVQQTGLSSASLPSFSKQEVPVVVAVLSAGVYDNVGRILPVPSILPEERVACTVETPQGKAQVHPSSVNRNLQTHGWLLYQEKVL